MSSSKSGSNFPFLGILGLIFVTLKLTGHIGWSWWWVTAPFWVPVAIAVPLAIGATIYAASVAKQNRPGDALDRLAASYRKSN